MSDRIWVGTRKGLFSLQRAPGAPGATGHWSVAAPQFPGDPVNMVLADPRDGALYAALDLGHFGVKLHRSDDGGSAWTEIGVPVYPAVPASSNSVTTEAPTLELIWSLQDAGPDQPGALWAGTIPGGLFRSEDRGDTWRRIDSLWDQPERAEWTGGGYDHAGIHSICVDPRDSRRVLVGVSTGGVWQTRDNGATWSIASHGMRAAYVPPAQAAEPNVQDVHRMVQCRAQPDTLWVQHHNGVFRSTDDAASWHEITAVKPSVFGFAAAVHPDAPDCAWFVPAVKDERRVPVDGRFVVSRTRDGGKTFEVLRQGLPQQAAYDLVYRHGMDIDATGERLVIGSTTGGLWISENGGTSWTQVEVRFPPIYCVHFSAR